MGLALVEKHSVLTTSLVAYSLACPTLAKVAIKHEVIPATQYAIGPNLFPFPPKNEGESINYFFSFLIR